MSLPDKPEEEWIEEDYVEAIADVLYGDQYAALSGDAHGDVKWAWIYSNDAAEKFGHDREHWYKLGRNQMWDRMWDSL